MLQDGDGNPGLFKYLQQGSPAVENYTLGIEWVAYALGVVLGVPVAPIYLLQYSGIAGAISPLLPNSMPFSLFYEKKAGPKPVSNRALMPLAVVFDIWIANCDRWPPNLLVQSDPVGAEVADAATMKIWLIDHGTCFLWPPIKYGLKEDGSDLQTAELGNGDTNAERAIRERITDSPVTRGYWATLANLSPAERVPLYDKVKAVDDRTIRKAFARVPGAYIGPGLMERTVQQIKLRRDRVDQLVERLLT